MPGGDAGADQEAQMDLLAAGPHGDGFRRQRVGQWVLRGAAARAPQHDWRQRFQRGRAAQRIAQAEIARGADGAMLLQQPGHRVDVRNHALQRQRCTCSGNNDQRDREQPQSDACAALIADRRQRLPGATHCGRRCAAQRGPDHRIIAGRERGAERRVQRLLRGLQRRRDQPIAGIGNACARIRQFPGCAHSTFAPESLTTFAHFA